MKKSLALLAVVALLVGANGCGSCRGLFGKMSAPCATPVFSQSMPAFSPTYAAGPSCGSSCNSCAPDAGCGCESGNEVTYGYDGF